MVEAYRLQMYNKFVFLWWKCKWILVFVEIWKRDPMYIAHDVMVHAVNEQKSAQLMRLASNVNVIWRKVKP
jgi:hypothetical protein